MEIRLDKTKSAIFVSLKCSLLPKNLHSKLILIKMLGLGSKWYLQAEDFGKSGNVYSYHLSKSTLLNCTINYNIFFTLLRQETEHPFDLRTLGENLLPFHNMRVLDFDALALFLTDYLLISKHLFALLQYNLKLRLKSAFDPCHLVLRK